jgi:hypothetical protein
MPRLQVTFGYYPDDDEVSSGDVSLRSLEGLSEIVDKIEKHYGVSKDWIYPSEGRIFSLPKTHVLIHENADCLDHLEFLIWCISFFVGMRLTTTEAGFLDATPIRPGRLTDFRLSNCTLADAISLAESFWRQQPQLQCRSRLIEATIHALFLSEYPRHLQFERFTYLYIALDACYALARSISGDPKISHPERFEWLCNHFELPTPSWAVKGASKNTEVSAIRNYIIHEALFFQKPLGFAHYEGNESSQNVLLEMHAVICRLLVALLGKPGCEYVTSPVNTRQIFGLDLKTACPAKIDL